MKNSKNSKSQNTGRMYCPVGLLVSFLYRTKTPHTGQSG